LIFIVGGKIKTSLKHQALTLLMIAVMAHTTPIYSQTELNRRNSMNSTDKDQIIAAVNGIAMAADKHDWETCKHYFTDIPFIDYSSLSGQAGAAIKVDELVTGWQEFLPKFRLTQHFITNHQISINGDKATCFSYVHAIHYLPYSRGGDLWSVYGTYNHELVKIQNDWKVSSMTFNLLYQEGNKILPAIAANQPKDKKLSFTSEGDKLTGVLFLPASYKEGDKLPAIIVTGSWTTVKEQMPTLYAKQLAQQGFATFIFDFRGFGESEGQPRQYESPARKIEDIRNAVTFVQTLPEVNKDEIGGLGICASSGYMAYATAEDHRIKSFAAIAPWLHNSELVKLIYGGDEGVNNRIKASETASANWKSNQTVTMVPACSSKDQNAAMYGNWDYYLNPKRGAIPEWKNQFNVISWKEWLTFDPISIASKIKAPVYLIHSEDAAIPQGVKQFYAKLTTSTKNITWTTGTQFDYYDNEKNVLEESKLVADWFKTTLK
jgi:hypothetical protein